MPAGHNWHMNAPPVEYEPIGHEMVDPLPGQKEPAGHDDIAYRQLLALVSWAEVKVLPAGGTLGHAIGDVMPTSGQ